MKIGFGSGGSTPGSAGQKAGLHQEGFIDIGNGRDVLGNQGGQSLEADRTAGVVVND